MNEKYLYLLLDLGSISVPFAFSFYSKAKFYKKWKYLWPAIVLPAIAFILWDEYFTQLGVWGFNERYLTGIFIGNLPLEEILFFICIPYACVFTYEALNYLIERDYFGKYSRPISITMAILLLILGVIHSDKWYTGVTFISLSLLLFYFTYLNPRFLGRFYFAYLIILIPFFIVNGVLTGSMIDEQVVWYNDVENLGIRMGTIPVEDTFYGMLLIILNVGIFEWLQYRQKQSRQS